MTNTDKSFFNSALHETLCSTVETLYFAALYSLDGELSEEDQKLCQLIFQTLMFEKLGFLAMNQLNKMGTPLPKKINAAIRMAAFYNTIPRISDLHFPTGLGLSIGKVIQMGREIFSSD